MKKLTSILIFIFVLQLISCKNKPDDENHDPSEQSSSSQVDKYIAPVLRKFPDVKNLSELQRTSFVPTLESNLPPNRNSIYAASLLYAWDEIRSKVDNPILVDSNYREFYFLNQSTSFKNTLKEDEYKTDVSVTDGVISARAFFSIELPFTNVLHSFHHELKFGNTNVASFGMIGRDDDILNTFEILYYKNDDNFILKLYPKNRQHEFVLYKSTSKLNSMSMMLTEIKSRISIGEKEMKDTSSEWKYFINETDEIIIPSFSFNLETNYSSMEGNTFQAGLMDFVLQTVYQRNAFVLDENGGRVESEAVITAAPAAEMPVEHPHPKHLVFNKPFFLMVKRAENPNPYFAMWVENAELMVRKDGIKN